MAVFFLQNQNCFLKEFLTSLIDVCQNLKKIGKVFVSVLSVIKGQIIQIDFSKSNKT